MTQHHPFSCQSCIAYQFTPAHDNLPTFRLCAWLIAHGACGRAALVAGALRGDWTVTAPDDRAQDARDGNEGAVRVLEIGKR